MMSRAREWPAVRGGAGEDFVRCPERVHLRPLLDATPLTIDYPPFP